MTARFAFVENLDHLKVGQEPGEAVAAIDGLFQAAVDHEPRPVARGLEHAVEVLRQQQGDARDARFGQPFARKPIVALHQAAQGQIAFRANDGRHMLVLVEEVRGVGEEPIVLNDLDEDGERAAQRGVNGLSEAPFARVRKRICDVLRPCGKAVRRDALVPALHARDEAEPEKRQFPIAHAHVEVLFG